ncbi:MAG: hypothetical protein J0I53_04370 [Chryseobacterium sp.]|nr:hypothetical protein [Chryseobacterium sp.]
MKDSYVIRDQGKPHFVTSTIIDWIDIFIDGFGFCIKNKGMVLWVM